jgi:Flp pilus assembly protein CpaB
MTYRLRNIGIAVALALVAGLLTVFYVTNYKREVRAGEENVTVYVAARDIPEGTTGEAIAREGYLTEQELAQRSVTPGAISSPEQIADKVVGAKIFAGEQVTMLRFTGAESVGIRGELTGNKRAIQVPGTQHQLLVGTLQDGDRVDVLATWNVPEGKTNHVSRVVLRDILVLDAAKQGANTEKLTNPNQSALSALLALTDAQAQKLFWVMQNGEWSLQLRPGEDAADSPESAESAVSLLRDGMREAP